MGVWCLNFDDYRPFSILSIPTKIFWKELLTNSFNRTLPFYFLQITLIVHAKLAIIEKLL